MTSPSEQSNKPKRRRRGDAFDEAVRTVTQPIANWQAKFAWACACWGLIPVAGLILGTLGVMYGLLGWHRVRAHPDDLGLRHAIGGIMVGTVELLCNAGGVYCLTVGLLSH